MSLKAHSHQHLLNCQIFVLTGANHCVSTEIENLRYLNRFIPSVNSVAECVVRMSLKASMYHQLKPVVISGIRIISNAGGINTSSCVAALKLASAKAGLMTIFVFCCLLGVVGLNELLRLSEFYWTLHKLPRSTSSMEDAKDFSQVTSAQGRE